MPSSVQGVATPGWLCVIAGKCIHLAHHGAFDAATSLTTLEFGNVYVHLALSVIFYLSFSLYVCVCMHSLVSAKERDWQRQYTCSTYRFLCGCCYLDRGPYPNGGGQQVRMLIVECF